MLDLAGRPMLAHAIDRMKSSRLTNKLVVVTTIDASDQPILDLASELGVEVYRGSETDPLHSFREAAKLYGAAHVVRLKGDCPLVDAGLVDAAIRQHLETGADYTGNVLERTYPAGLDVEILTREALETVWKESGLRSEREHVTLYVHKHPEKFRISHLKQQDDQSAKRWTVDYSEDYELLRRIFEELYPADPRFGMRAVLDFLAARPELESINAHFRIDAGVLISLARDGPATRPPE